MRIVGCITIDLTKSLTAVAARRAIRRAVDTARDGDTVRFTVASNSVPFEVSDLIPANITVQITAPDAYTLRAWQSAIEGVA